MIKTILKTIAILLGIIVLYLLFYPVSFEPVAYTPPPNPGLETGAFAKNTKLASTTPLLSDQGTGPEDIAMGPDSLLYTAYEDGRIVRFSLDGKKMAGFANTGGRPLGLQFDAQGNLIVADQYKGLLLVDPLGAVRVLADEVAGTKIFFADHLDITSDGIIYFSDASQRNHDIETEVWELQPTGRLLSYNPTTKKTKIELEGMRFANGIALGPNDEYLLITETFGMKINKFWLKGAKKGTKEVWVNELPGFPDNISYNDKGIFWVAIPNLRLPEFEPLYDKPFLRKVLKRLPSFMINAPEPTKYGMVIGFDESAKVVENLQDPSGNLQMITSANEFDGTLYLGSLWMSSVGKYNLSSKYKQ